MKNIFKFFLISIYAATALSAQKDNVEYYSDRPNVLELRARVTKKSDWQNLNWAQLEFIAQLLGLYPKQHFFFLARDGEYLYDLGLVLTENNPELRKRLHLINVSRNNQHKKELKQYLEQNGLTESFIKKNGVVFVDSGFSGSIAKHIQQKYKVGTREQMLIHLIESNEDSIPDSEMFKNRDAMDASSYEEMVRFFDRSDGFKKLNGRWVPVSPKGESEPYDSDGTVDKKEAVRYMQSMTAFGRTKAAQSKFHERLKQWKYLSDLAFHPKLSLEQVISVLEKIRKTWKSETAEAMIKDFVSFYNLSSGKKVKLGEVVFNSGYKNQVPKISFDYDTMLTELESTFNTDFKTYSERDFNDLLFILKMQFQSGSVESVVQFLSSVNDKQFMVLLNKMKSGMGQKEFEKFFHQAVKQIDYTNQKQWFEAYKKLQLESKLIQKELKSKIEEFESYTDPATVRACRKAIGA